MGFETDKYLVKVWNLFWISATSSTAQILSFGFCPEFGFAAQILDSGHCWKIQIQNPKKAGFHGGWAWGRTELEYESVWKVYCTRMVNTNVSDTAQKKL